LYRAKLMCERTKQSLSETIEQAINNTFKGSTEEQMKVLTARQELHNDDFSNE
jgi:hypothetical protein